MRSVQHYLLQGLLAVAISLLVYWAYTALMTQRVTHAITSIQESAMQNIGQVQEKQARLAREAGERAAAARAEAAAAARAAAEQAMRQQEQDRLKAEAWARYYVAPAACNKPPTWDFQVECGNGHIRARRAFEAEWDAKQGATRVP